MLEVNTFWKKERDTLFKWGQAEGIEKGMLLERTKAEAEKKEIARSFRNKHIALEIIAEATGLSIEEIEAL